MNPLFFGRSDHQLFGVYHAPARSTSRRGVVLCYPWGQEYMRAHRAFRFLGESLAQAGLHVLRFDYWGTGDSGGDISGDDDPTWASDVTLAIQELIDVADLRKVALCGLRMGAHWAARAADGNRRIDRIALWDPVVDGAAYVGEMIQGAAPDGKILEVDGFVLTDPVREALETASDQDFLDLEIPTLVLRTTEHAPTDALVSKLRSRDPSVVSRVTPSPPAWKEENGDFGTSGMPVAALQEITTWLSEA